MTEIARRGEPHGSGLGKTRWVVERTISWLHNFRRLRIRFERLAFIHEAFMKIACCIHLLAKTAELILLTLVRRGTGLRDRLSPSPARNLFAMSGASFPSFRRETTGESRGGGARSRVSEVNQCGRVPLFVFSGRVVLRIRMRRVAYQPFTALVADSHVS